MYDALIPLAVYALVLMRKRRVPISPMVAIFAMVTIAAAISIGITRYRVGADVALVVLGGVGVDALWRWLAGGSAPPAEPTPSDTRPVDATPEPVTAAR